MFDGRDYKVEFDSACEALAKTNDKVEIGRILLGVEWVLEEAFRGALVIFACSLSVLVFLPISLLFDIRTMSWTEQSVYSAFIIAFGVGVYWLGKFVIWYEISRHLKPRKFGEYRFPKPDKTEAKQQNEY